MEKIKKVKESVEKSLERIQEKSWAEPLGKAMGTTGSIIKGCGSFIPGVGIVGGALSFGSTLLNPQPSLQDLETQLGDLKAGLELISSENVSIRRALEDSMKTLQEKIENPPSEIRSDFDEIKSEMQDIMTNIQQNNDCITNEIASIKDITSKTFNLVTDIRYKVSILYIY